jgi:translation initiation factor 1 (eIF-1/SUI1)
MVVTSSRLHKPTSLEMYQSQLYKNTRQTIHVYWQTKKPGRKETKISTRISTKIDKEALVQSMKHKPSLN